MKELMAKLVSISGDFDGWMYSTVLFWALIIVGLCFSVRTKFVQIRLLPEGIRVLTEKSHEGGMSSFQALMIATASRVGTGNIAGVATAVVAGDRELLSGCGLWLSLVAHLHLSSQL